MSMSTVFGVSADEQFMFRVVFVLFMGLTVVVEALNAQSVPSVRSLREAMDDRLLTCCHMFASSHCSLALVPAVSSALKWAEPRSVTTIQLQLKNSDHILVL